MCVVQAIHYKGSLERIEKGKENEKSLRGNKADKILKKRKKKQFLAHENIFEALIRKGKEKKWWF